MLSISLLKNKNLFLLSTIFFAIFNGQCYGAEAPKNQESENSVAWGITKFVGSIVLNALVTHMLTQYNKDPELEALNKEAKILQIKKENTPGYFETYILHQKNNAEERAIKNKEKQLDVDIARGQLKEHHKNELLRFKRCNEQGLKQIDCDQMIQMHNQELEYLMKKTVA